MRLNDGAADPESHAGAMGFGGKERVEDVVRMLRGQANAGIADGHQKLIAFCRLRLDC